MELYTNNIACLLIEASLLIKATLSVISGQGRQATPRHLTRGKRMTAACLSQTPTEEVRGAAHTSELSPAKQTLRCDIALATSNAEVDKRLDDEK